MIVRESQENLTSGGFELESSRVSLETLIEVDTKFLLSISTPLEIFWLFSWSFDSSAILTRAWPLF